MSLKNMDNKNRWRSKTVGFRVSPEEDAQIETAVRLSGLTKQDYITRGCFAGMLLCRAIRECTRHSATDLPPFWVSCGALKLVRVWMMNCSTPLS